MYEWTLCLSGYIIIGRTWEDFIDVCKRICSFYNLSQDNRLIIYVHNLSYEFQFIRKRFEWYKVFSLDKRKPIQAVSNCGIEFRCSYYLSGYGLAKLSDQLIKYKVNKMVGDLDYDLVRHSETPLTEKELGYCRNDCLVVVAYIQEQIERLGNITKLPLTKTGYVRKYCRDMCLYDGKTHTKNTNKFHKYRRIMKILTITPKEYELCKRAFMGGFTHANAKYSCCKMEKVSSFDFTSSYPYVMISEQFPMSKPEKIFIKSEKELYDNLKNYCCMFDIEFENLKSSQLYENYISKSHCRKLEDFVENNGRIVSAKRLSTTITEQDFTIIKLFYTWEHMTIRNFHRFKKNYLPRDFVLSILNLYVNKTTLKGVEGKEIEYLESKERLNSCYGMCVTDICRDEILYTDEMWDSESPNIEEAIDKYNKSVKRFLYYPWGVWVTAYARRNLFTGIYAFKDDYIYSDTDSIKVINVDKHMDYINKYNDLVLHKLKRAMDIQGIDIELTKPKNKKGEEKQIGIWDYEGEYEYFKTLGAKRYIVKKKDILEVDGKKYDYSITVSGLNKTVAVPYLLEKYGEKIIDSFDDNLYVPPQYTGKMTHTYIDDEKCGSIVDYLGNIGYFNELSAVHLEDCDYDLSLSDVYVNYLLNIKES